QAILRRPSGAFGTDSQYTPAERGDRNREGEAGALRRWAGSGRAHPGFWARLSPPREGGPRGCLGPVRWAEARTIPHGWRLGSVPTDRAAARGGFFRP